MLRNRNRFIAIYNCNLSNFEIDCFIQLFFHCVKRANEKKKIVRERNVGMSGLASRLIQSLTHLLMLISWHGWGCVCVYLFGCYSTVHIAFDFIIVCPPYFGVRWFIHIFVLFAFDLFFLHIHQFRCEERDSSRAWFIVWHTRLIVAAD